VHPSKDLVIPLDRPPLVNSVLWQSISTAPWLVSLGDLPH